MFGVIGIVLGIVGASQVVQFGQNLEATIKTGRPLLVQFYAPWCGHCQQLAPTWEKVADKIGRDVAVGKLDCTQYQTLAQKYGIRGFPTIKFFRNGKYYNNYGIKLTLLHSQGGLLIMKVVGQKWTLSSLYRVHPVLLL